MKSYEQGSVENKFIAENAPEVYYRGLSDYDIVTSNNVLGKASDVLKGRKHGLYKAPSSRFKVIASELINSESDFSSRLQLSSMVFFDRAAARTTFFSLYKNYMESYGLEVDYTSPNQDALNFAINGVRETQFTDNPLYKSGVSYNIIAGGKSGLSDFGMQNLLAFKSYSINERALLAKANERFVNNILEGNFEDAVDDGKYLMYSMISKLAFNYLKIYFAKHVMAFAVAQLLYGGGDDKERRNFSYHESTDAQTQFSAVAVKSILDYFVMNDLVKWGATLAVMGAEGYIKDGISEDEAAKYNLQDFDSGLATGFVFDVIDNISMRAKRTKSYYDELGLKDQTLPSLSQFSIVMYNALQSGFPFAGTANDFAKELERQQNIVSGKVKTDDRENDNKKDILQ